jgi:hypothetical protein
MATGFRARLASHKGAQGVAWHPRVVIDFPNIIAVGLMLMVIAVFAVMIWAGSHQH